MANNKALRFPVHYISEWGQAGVGTRDEVSGLFCLLMIIYSVMLPLLAISPGGCEFQTFGTTHYFVLNPRRGWREVRDQIYGDEWFYTPPTSTLIDAMMNLQPLGRDHDNELPGW